MKTKKSQQKSLTNYRSKTVDVADREIKELRKDGYYVAQIISSNVEEKYKMRHIKTGRYITVYVNLSAFVVQLICNKKILKEFIVK